MFRLTPRTACLVLLLCGGCSRHETNVESGARAQILHLGNKDEPQDLDPDSENAATTGHLLSSLYEGLVTYSPDGNSILPGAADRWEISADGLTYTFHLRTDGRWSNGDPVTSSDFRDSFLRVIDPAVGSEQANQAFPLVGAREFLAGRNPDPASVGLRTPDDHTLVTILRHPAPYWLGILAQNGPLWPLHMRSVDAADGRHQRAGAWTHPGQLVGNGPFVLAEWRPNAVIRVVRNPYYWDAAHVRLKEVRFYPTDDEGAEERSYRAGQLHVTYRLPQSKVAVYERDRPAEIQVSPQLRTNFLTFNVTRPPFTDARVRRAFSLAVNRETLVSATLGKLGTPAHAMTRTGTGGYTARDTVQFDPVAARRLLAEAGFPEGRGLPPIEFTLNGNAGVTLLIGAALQEMWAHNLGVAVTIQPLEFKVYLTASREKQFQVLLDGWGSGLADPRDLLQVATAGDPNNDSAWGDADYDALFAAADSTGVVAERQRAFDAMEALLAREVPYAPLYYTNQGFLVHPSVHGWQGNPLRVTDWRAIWLDPPK